MNYSSHGRQSGGQRPFTQNRDRGAFRRAPAGNRFGRSSGGRPRTDHIDVTKFINKAVITESVDNFAPEHAFTDFAIDERLKRAVVLKGYTSPTPIQDRIIPHILHGSDVVGIANTGTGKTAAFLIPLIHLMLGDRALHTLIVVPTRELAIQIEEEYRSFTRGLQMYSVCCVGGASIGFQIRELRRNPQVVIGTPGRLKDLIERKVLNLSLFRVAVLDEADRMLDMGFINDMRFILSRMQKDRHTLFFSATISRDIEKLIGDFLREPVRISVKTQDTSKNVEQDVVRIPEGKQKLDVLCDLLLNSEFSKVLIFGQTKHGVEKLAKTLVARNFRAESIHGNKTHGKRQSALKLFRQSHVQVLVATDVAARGLDIDGVSHVINFDIPATYDDYVHRIGRTGRGTKRGKALTFVEHGHGQRTAPAPRQTHWRR